MDYWVPLTADDLSRVFAPREMEALASVSDAGGIAEEVADVVAQVREAVANNGANRLAPGDTIPRTLRACALDLLAVRVLKRYALQVTEARAKAAEAASQRLADVAAAKYAVIMPDGHVPASPARQPWVASEGASYGTPPEGIWPAPTPTRL